MTTGPAGASAPARRDREAPWLRASLVLWSVYMIGAGAALALVPGPLLGVLGLGEGPHDWVRAFGVLAINLGLVYIPILRAPVQPELIRWTVLARGIFAAFTVLAVALGWFPPGLLAIGAFDALNASWTAVAARRAGMWR